MAMRHVVMIETYGGPEVLKPVDAAMPSPGDGEVLVENKAIGLNFVDVYHRTGLYPVPLPAVPGVEGAGVVARVGAGVTELKPGDRIVYAGAPLGAYASHRLLPAARAIHLPDDVSFETAAASFIKGLTVDMLFNSTFKVGEHATMLVHSAAGGLGTFICAWAKTVGACVIGTVSSPAKAEVARAAGADEVIIGRETDFVVEVMRLTGQGVDIVYDGVGGSTILKSLQSVRPFGAVVSLGQVGGPIAPISIEEIGRRSAALWRPSIIAYTSNASNYANAAGRVLAKLQAGVASAIGGRFALSDVRAAHTALEAGNTQGSTLLIP
jgi:NADPH2:quinone reductase